MYMPWKRNDASPVLLCHFCDKQNDIALGAHCKFKEDARNLEVEKH